MLDNFFETVKEDIKNEKKESNVTLIEKFWTFQSKPGSFCISKFWHYIFRQKTYEDQSTTCRGFKKEI